MERKTEKTDYCCPLCFNQLTLVNGDSMNPANGFTLYCTNRDCPAQEVSGHGKNAQKAYAIILNKYTDTRSEIESNGEE